MIDEADIAALKLSRRTLSKLTFTGDRAAAEIVLMELDRRDATIARLVSALKTIGMRPYFIDALLATPGAAPATEENS